MNISIKRIDKSLPLPEYATVGSCAFDLYSRESVTIQPGEIFLLPSNIIVATPGNHVLILAARSSLLNKKGLVLANAIGVIDQDYAGNDDEIKIMVKNVSDAPVTVERAERIAQGLFLPVTKAVWQEVDTMEQVSRGGIGSTGGYHGQEHPKGTI